MTFCVVEQLATDYKENRDVMTLHMRIRAPFVIALKEKKKNRSNRGIHLFSDNHCWLIWFLPYPHMLQVRRQKVPTNLRLHLFWRAAQNLGNVSKQQPPRRRQNFEFMILNLFKSSISRPKSSKSLRSSSSKLPE